MKGDRKRRALVLLMMTATVLLLATKVLSRPEYLSPLALMKNRFFTDLKESVFSD